ncbi:MAG TPA: hypothetical protein VJ767_00965 [Nitrososphaeraceae archaeon]|nr:hypothetical protein [Nitrososphaeraceae archaeon]
MNKKVEFDGGNSIRRNNKSVNEKAIKDSVKWSITEYSVFVSKLVKRGLSLNIDKKLEKGWFSGIYVNYQGEINFTDPFTMDNRHTNNDIIGAVGSFNLNDCQEYYVIPETNNKFVEVLDNKGEIDPDFPLKDYHLHLSHISSDSKYASKVSIRKYDDAVSNFIKNEIQKGSFLDLFEIYIEEKINKLNNYANQSKVRKKIISRLFLLFFIL